MTTACIHALAASCAAAIGGVSEEPTKMNSLYPMGRKRGGAGSAHDCREFCRSWAVWRQKGRWEAGRSTANATKLAQRKGPWRIWHHDPFEKSGPWRSDRSALALSSQLTADREPGPIRNRARLSSATSGRQSGRRTRRRRPGAPRCGAAGCTWQRARRVPERQT